MKKNNHKSLFLKIGFLALVMVIWEALSLMHIWDDFIFPSPVNVIKDLVAGIGEGTYITAILISMKRIAIGFGLAMAGGVGLGLLLGRSKLAEDTIGTLVLGLQTLPSICWLPLALLWFGLNEKAIIFIIIIGSMLSISIATMSGIKNIHPLYLRAAQTFGAKGYKLYSKVIIPASIPSIITGLKQGWSFAWRSLMAGELLYISLGLGHILMMGRELNDINQVVSAMLIIMLIAMVIDRLIFSRLETMVYKRWGLAN
ncbi:MAG: ABC transporter permease [Planctomycetes bacterium]|nr:ABC transporter permease [Planctomycetota bacterium]